MTSFSPATLPAGGDAKIDRPVVHLRRKTAVLGLALLGDVHVAEDFEDIDDRFAHVAAERVGGLQHAVDADSERSSGSWSAPGECRWRGAVSPHRPFPGRPCSPWTRRRGPRGRIFLRFLDTLADESQGGAARVSFSSWSNFSLRYRPASSLRRRLVRTRSSFGTCWLR